MVKNAHHCRATAKDYLGDKAGALADYTLEIEVNPDCANAYYDRGITKISLGVEDKQGAYLDWSRAAALGHPNAMNLLKTLDVRYYGN